jgi:uncharacterized protein YjbI with pentapeptide repeats
VAQERKEESLGANISPELDVETILYTLTELRKELSATLQYTVIALDRTDLRRADLFEAKLSFAYFSTTDLSGAYLEGADLSDAYLRDADLTNADLTDADLDGARGLSQKQIEQAIGNEITTLPGGLTRPAAWTHGREEPPDQMPADQ